MRVRALLESVARRAPGGRLVTDVVRAAILLREVDRARWTEGPATLVERLRERGRHEPARSAIERRLLFHAVHQLDRVLGGEPNCYRRALARVALDRVWAAEPVVLGLDVEGVTGHAWVAGTGESPKPYDVEFRV